MAPPKRIFGANICFDCERACGGCSWTEVDPETGKLRWEPVPGWTAEKTYLTLQSTSHGKHKKAITETYHIIDCPLFVPTPPRKVEELPAVYEPRICIWCGGTLISKNPQTRYCSERCLKEKRYAQKIANRERARKWAAEHKGVPKKPTPNDVAVICTNPKTGKETRYGSITEAAFAAETYPGTISRACTIGRPYKGFLYRRENED